LTVSYPSRTDWYHWVLAAGMAELEMDGRSIGLADPRVLSREEGYQLMSSDAESLPGWIGVEERLLLRPYQSSHRRGTAI